MRYLATCSFLLLGVLSALVVADSTAYEVRTRDDAIECQFRDPRLGNPEWIALSEFRAKLATLLQIPVVVKGKAKGAVVEDGQPIPICVTVENDLKGAIEFRGYGVKPTDWNAETVSLSLVDIYRDGKAEALLLARPVVKPPREIAGLARTVIAPGESLTIETDATKWTIKGGWVPGRYRVKVRVERLGVDEYSTLNVSSEPFEFEITDAPGEKTKKAVEALKANLEVLVLDLVFRGKPHQFTDSLTLLGPKVVYERDVGRPVLQLTTAQVAKIVDHLADSGFFERATNLKGQMTVDVPKGPVYTLSIRVDSDGSSVPDGSYFWEDLGWSVKMLHRLDGLRTAMADAAAEAMDKLLARLAPQRREWEKGEALKRGIDSFGLHIRYHGNGDEDRRFPSLMLSVPPIEDQKKDLRGPVVRIDCEQALRIIDQLNAIYLRWGPGTVDALEGIRNVSKGDAAQAMDKLLDALEAGRQERDKPTERLQHERAIQ